MQYTLLGLALLLIAAIAAALAAPAFVDWNQWRPAFESRASALLGAPVHIRGNIEATILPTPSFTLREVEVGPADTRALRLGSVRATLALGPLLTGRVRAEELVLQRPTLRVALESGGRVLLPMPALRVDPDQIAISRIAIEDGAVVVEDRVSGTSYVLSDLAASGELRSLLGPFRIDAAARLGERRWNLRLSTGRFGPDASARVRIAIEAADGGAALEAEGALALGDVPQFEGKASLAFDSGRWRIAANVRATTALVQLETLQLALGETPFELAGTVRIEPPVRRIDATLSARRVDLDRASEAKDAPRDFAKARATLRDLLALATAPAYSGRIVLSVENIAAGGGILREVRAELLLRRGGIGIERFEARLPGPSLVRASGKAESAVFDGELLLESEEPAALMRWLGIAVAESDEQLRIAGRVAIRPDAAHLGRTAFETDLRVEGLGALVQAWIGEGERAALARRVAAVLSPLKLTGSISAAGPSASIVEAAANISDVDVAFRAKVDPKAEIPVVESRLVFSARDTGRLAALFGLAPGLPADGEARLEFAAAGPKNGALALSARLVAPGVRLTGEGEIRSGAEGSIEPNLLLRLEATDLRPLAARFARVARVLPATGSARLVRADGGFALENLDAFTAGARLSGRLAFSSFEPLALAGKLAVDQAELAALAGLALGVPETNSDGFWPAAPLLPALLDGATGTLEFVAAKLGLGGPIVAEDGRFTLKFEPARAEIRDFSARLGGARLSGSAEIARGETLALEGRMALVGADLSRVLAAAGLHPDLRGRGDLNLAFAGSGKTPAALVASLAGQGMLLLEGFELDRFDPSAVATVLTSAAAPPPDETKTATMLSALLQRGPLKLARIEAPITLAAGVARTGSIRTSADFTQVAAQANVDVSRFALDAEIELEAPVAVGSSARAVATVRWRGPLVAPERSIDAAALSSALAIGAMEREMREIEKRDAKPTVPPTGVPPIMVEPPKPAPPPAARTPVPQVRPAAPRPQPSSTVPALPPPLDISPPPGSAPRRLQP